MNSKLFTKLCFPLKMQYLSKEVPIWRGKTPFKTMLVYSAGNLQLENCVMCNAHQVCHDSGFACREGCFCYQNSGSEAATWRQREKSRGDSPQLIGLAAVHLQEILTQLYFHLVMKFSTLHILLHLESWFYTYLYPPI